MNPKVTLNHANPQIQNPRTMGIMLVHSPIKPILETDIRLASKIGASFAEILPRWSQLPSATEITKKVRDAGLSIWSVHGPWGGQSIEAVRVDLADLNPRLRQESVDDLLRALDWSSKLDAQVLVVHPGGVSKPEEKSRRTDVLTRSLERLAIEAQSRNMRIGLENMPAGVFPGSQMADLAAIVRHLDQASLGLVMDTGHAQISGNIRQETLAAKNLLISTHVHDNNGSADSHRPPGDGLIDWPAWFASLNEIQYQGTIMLECVKALREMPAGPPPEWIDWWHAIMQNSSL